MTCAVANLPRSNVAGRDRGWALGRWFVPAGVVALVTVSIALRAWKLDNIPGLNGDEAWGGVQALRLARGEPAAWRTPTGNPLNPFFFGPLVLLHVAFEPSIGLLRSVALASGLLALAAGYWLCKAAFGQRTAVVCTLLLAVLPINVAYSRFAWDASQTPLASMLAIGTALLAVARPERRGTWTTAIVSLAAAVLVHPTNILLAPLVVCAVMHGRPPNWTRWLTGSRKNAASALVLVGLLIATSAGKLAFPADALGALLNLVRLLSGATVYRYISGSIPHNPLSPAAPWNTLDAWDVAVGCGMVLAVIGAVKRLRQRGAVADRCLVIGWLATLAAFYLLAGPSAAAPHFERYAMCLVVPTVLVLARGIDWWLGRARSRPWAFAGLATAGVLLPLTFYQNYFEFIEHTGGRSHRTFHTAAVEPKLQAWRTIAAARNPSGAQCPTWVIASEWWNAWPLRYLSGGTADVQVAAWDELPLEVRSPESLASGNVWFVEYAGSRAEDEVGRRLSSHALAVERTLIDDYSGRPLLAVLHAVPDRDRRPLHQVSPANSTAPNARPASESSK